MFEALTAAKIAAAAGQGALNMAASMKKTKDIRRLSEDVQGLSADLRAVNGKLDALIGMGQDQVLGRLTAANKKLDTCMAVGYFTKQDIQTIEERYLDNTGLSRDGKTGAYENRRIIAYSWWGLALLESQTGGDAIKMSRYIVEMFQAELPLARKFFPEIYAQFYKAYIDEYEKRERRYVTWISGLEWNQLEYLLKNQNAHSISDPIGKDETEQYMQTNANDIDAVLEFYGWDKKSRNSYFVSSYCEDVNKEWTGGGLRGRFRAVKSAANGMATGLALTYSDELRQFAKPIYIQIFLKDIVSERMNLPEYREKRRDVIVDMLTEAYLKALRR